ncbi:MAG: hypothetical protein R2820_07280 [Cyclobacteriaceae bacterium]
MKTGDFDQYVDRVLKQYLDGEPVFIYAEIEKVIPELEKKNEKRIFIDFLTHEGLFASSIDSFSGGTLLKITPKGYGIYLSGGWTMHVEHGENKRNLEIQLVKSSIRTNRTSVIILVITVLISVMSVTISWLDYKGNSDKQTIPDTLEIKKNQPSIERTSDSIKDSVEVDSAIK